MGFDPSLTGQFLPAGTCTLVFITWRFHIKSTAGIDVSMPAPSPVSKIPTLSTFPSKSY